MFKILIVDDKFSDREGLRDLVNWKSLGINSVELATNGLEGYHRALKIRPDLVLTDISMPIMDGLKMAEKIKEEIPSIKFIFMSCLDEFNYVKTALDINAYGYILKPINIDRLVETIAKVLNVCKVEIANDHAMKELEHQVAESMPILQEQLVRDLLYGKIQLDNHMNDKLSRMKMELQKYYAVALIHIDHFDEYIENNPIEKKYFLIYQIKKCLENIDKNGARIFNSVLNNNSFAMLLYLDDSNDEQEALSKVLNYFNECREQVNQEININITIGLGGVSDTFTDISKLYENAEYAIQSKICSKGNSIILADEIKITSNALQYNFPDLKNEIFLILENGSKELVIEFIDKYYNDNLNLPESYIKGLSFTIINIMQLVLFERNESFNNIFDDELVVWKKLTKIETIIDIRQWMINMLIVVREYLERRENSRYTKIIEDIKQIIDKKYAEIENINQIATELYLSNNHVNSIFKRYTGETIFDYLIYRRMEVAKKLLIDPYCKIYEISERVGYKSKTYFASIFKEYIGMTPKEYRDKYSK